MNEAEEDHIRGISIPGANSLPKKYNRLVVVADCLGTRAFIVDVNT